MAGLAALRTGLGRVTRRRWVQILSTIVLNPIVPNFFTGSIVQLRSKGVCVPVLNCYSCPSALGACPIGSLQHAVAGIRYRLSIGEVQLGLYTLGSIGVVGSLVGRFPCGWLCPFGLLQEWLHKIPGPKLRIPRVLRYLKYVVLVLTVIVLPAVVLNAVGFGETWFCKWICPAGTLEAGIPLVAANAGIRGMVGLLFVWKVSLLVLFLLWMIVSHRPFCRTICPMGALLGLFNRVSLLRLRVDHSRCLSCGSCSRACPVELDVLREANSPECIRCLKCVKACDAAALDYQFPLHRSGMSTEPAGGPEPVP